MKKKLFALALSVVILASIGLSCLPGLPSDPSWKVDELRWQQEVWEVEDECYDLQISTAALTREHQLEVRSLNEEIERLSLQLELLQELNSENETGWTGLANFADMADLHRFLVEEQLWKIEWADDFDCDNFAFTLMEHGARWGYAVYPTVVIFTHGNQIVGGHLMNFVLVEKLLEGRGKIEAVVLIEPQTLEFYVMGSVDDEASWARKILPFMP